MKSMSEFQEPVSQTATGTPRWVGLAVAVLAGLSVIGLAVGWSALSQVKGVEQSTQASLRQINEALAQRLAKAEDINQQLESDLKVVTDKLNLTQEQLVSARKQTKATAVGFDKKLTGLQNDVNTQLATKANAEDVNKLNGDVTGVKSDLDATRTTCRWPAAKWERSSPGTTTKSTSFAAWASATITNSRFSARPGRSGSGASKWSSATPTQRKISSPLTSSQTTRTSRRRTAP